MQNPSKHIQARSKTIKDEFFNMNNLQANVKIKYIIIIALKNKWKLI